MRRVMAARRSISESGDIERMGEGKGGKGGGGKPCEDNSAGVDNQVGGKLKPIGRFPQ